MNRLDRFFEVTRRGSTVAAEMRGGLVSFIAMAYIVVLNPIILSGPQRRRRNTLQFTQVSAVTALAAGIVTILFGLITRLAVRVRRGPGHQLVPRHIGRRRGHLAEAMGPVVISGLVIVVLAAHRTAPPGFRRGADAVGNSRSPPASACSSR